MKQVMLNFVPTDVVQIIQNIYGIIKYEEYIMKIKVVKGKIGIKGERHLEGEVFDCDSVMARHLLGQGLVEAVVDKVEPETVVASLTESKVEVVVELVEPAVEESVVVETKPQKGKKGNPKK
jgi:hypothetical protein